MGTPAAYLPFPREYLKVWRTHLWKSVQQCRSDLAIESFQEVLSPDPQSGSIVGSESLSLLQAQAT